MSQAKDAPPRGPRDRPVGLAPGGTAWGLAAIMLFAVVSPIAAVFSSAEWAPLSLDGFLGFAFAAPFISLPVFLPVGMGLQTRRFWVVCWYFGAGVLCLALYAAAVLVALLQPLHLVAVVHPAMAGVSWAGRLALLACAPMLFALWRGLRLNYWRPWSLPETWETGDERNARWAMRLVDGKSP